MMAKANRSHPPYFADSFTVTPVSSIMSAGITGIMIPSPVISSKRVIKINSTAGVDLPAITPAKVL